MNCFSRSRSSTTAAALPIWSPLIPWAMLSLRDDHGFHGFSQRRALPYPSVKSVSSVVGIPSPRLPSALSAPPRLSPGAPWTCRRASSLRFSVARVFWGNTTAPVPLEPLQERTLARRLIHFRGANLHKRLYLKPERASCCEAFQSAGACREVLHQFMPPAIQRARACS